MSNINIGRAALYAFLFGVLLILAGPVLVWASPPAVNLIREVFGVSRVYFAVRAFLNFATGGLLNLIGVQAFVAAVILLGLRSGRRCCDKRSTYPHLHSGIACCPEPDENPVSQYHEDKPG